MGLYIWNVEAIPDSKFLKLSKGLLATTKWIYAL